MYSQAIHDVIFERGRQINEEGWTSQHDDGHAAGELAEASCSYSLYAADTLHPLSQSDGDWVLTPPGIWPWSREWWKPTDPRRALVKAAALAIAEIERYDREQIMEGYSNVESPEAVVA